MKKYFSVNFVVETDSDSEITLHDASTIILLQDGKHLKALTASNEQLNLEEYDTDHSEDDEYTHTPYADQDTDESYVIDELIWNYEQQLLDMWSDVQHIDDGNELLEELTPKISDLVKSLNINYKGNIRELTQNLFVYLLEN